MCGRTIDITLPLTAHRVDGEPEVGSPVVQWLDTNGTPEVWRTSEKSGRIPEAESVLARAVKWAACWGPCAWYFRGITYGHTHNVDRTWEDSAFMVFGSEPPATPDRAVLWAGLPVYYGRDGSAPEAVGMSSGTTNPAGWSRTPLPRMWWILPPELTADGGRLFVAHLELAALTGREEPVSLVFPP